MQEDFLIFCKRLLPRWINGIPDSECLAIFRTLDEIDSDQAILLETGCGASTLTLFLYTSLKINYKIMKRQRYGIDDHINWLINGKPESLNLHVSEQTDKNYEDLLVKNGFDDYFIIVGTKK